MTKDDDGYIVDTHAQLNAIRYDLDGNGVPDAGATDYGNVFPNRVTTSSGRMGCPSGTCTGYELAADIDLDTDGDGSIGTDTDDAYHNSGWDPIGTSANKYSGDFKSNGHTINNLFIDRDTTNNIGLFGAIGATVRIETLGVTNANVTGGNYTGALAGRVYGGGGGYTTGAVTETHYVGGLVDITNVGAASASIRSSYSTAYVVGSSNVGGLIGRLANGSMPRVYATGRVTRASGNMAGSLGGIAGASSSNVTASYYDTSTSGCVTGGSPGCTDGDGGNTIAGIVGKTTRELQTVTSYTSIFANWNAPIVGERVGVCIAPGFGVTRATVSGQSYKKGVDLVKVRQRRYLDCH